MLPGKHRRPTVSSFDFVNRLMLKSVTKQRSFDLASGADLLTIKSRERLEDSLESILDIQGLLLGYAGTRWHASSHGGHSGPTAMVLDVGRCLSGLSKARLLLPDIGLKPTREFCKW